MSEDEFGNIDDAELIDQILAGRQPGVRADQRSRETAYHYAIAIWRASKLVPGRPEQRREYAAMQATAIILRSRFSLLILRDDLMAHADRSDCSSDRVEPS